MRRLILGVGVAGLGIVALDRGFPPPAPPSVATEILARDGRLLSVLPAPGGVWRLATSPRDVPPELLEQLLANEDRRFRQHPGVDPLALARAAWQWVRAGRVVSGGSTITMQVARLLEPRPRTLRAKAIEIARALQLEARHSKEEILSLWLTLAPMGGNLEGVRAGALAWFGRPAIALDAAEAALLVALPRRPEALRPDRHPVAAAVARDRALRRAGDVAAEAPVPVARLPMPDAAPHLARELARAAPGERRIVTTIDLALQREAASLVATARLPERTAMAIVVADLAGGELRAVVGGAWGDPTRAGGLDLTRAVRSPGSAFKPALYALAFDRGPATPATLVEDLPRRFGAYAPENYDRGFAGPVTLAEALRRSLNLPAVALLDSVGPIAFAAALKTAGAPARLPPHTDAALPLALGGFGTTLREAVGLHAALAHGGIARPLHALPGEVAATSAFAPRAAGQVMDILTRPFPTGGPSGIAWKTGTSWGGRDAWALGADRRHAAGVWVGRPDGTLLPAGATGAGFALPWLAALFERLPPAPRAATPTAVATGATGADRLRLVFPPPGAVLPPDAPVILRASGGQRPLRFLIDGAPLASEAARRETAWRTPGPGFHRVTVLDATGAAATVELRIRTPEAAVEPRF